MRIQDCFEVEGLQLENGAAVLSGTYDPRVPPVDNIKIATLLIEAPEGSVFIRINGELYQKKEGRWARLETQAGIRTAINEGDSLLIENEMQYSVYANTFKIDGDLVIEGKGELIIHE